MRNSYKTKRNYDGNSNNMETNGLERVFNKICDSISNKNKTFSHNHCNQMHQFLKSTILWRSEKRWTLITSCRN